MEKLKLPRHWVWNSALCILLSLTLNFQTFSQNRGSFSFASPPAMVIKQRVDFKPDIILPDEEMLPSVFSQSVVSSVGGISFGATAKKEGALDIQSLSIGYNASLPDGERMELTINGKPVAFRVYDWMLKPIAGFSDSEFNSCFTYFGQLQDTKLEETILRNGGHVLNYHPALQNTLLGWRLSDMDILILYDFTSDLPRINNKVILGAGEAPPDVQANNYGAYEFSSHINKIEKKLGYSFQSYIITDFSRDVTFSIARDSLFISGFPYYYCWKYQNSLKGYDINKVAAEIKKGYETTIKEHAGEAFDVREFFIDSLIAIAGRYEKGYNLFRAGTFNDLLAVPEESGRRDFLRRYATESLGQMAIEVTAQMAAQTPVHLKSFSDRMSEDPEMIRACNPAVWDATVMTMRLSAFFRYLKLNFPAQWESFAATIANISIQPEVTTPTVLFDKGHPVLTGLFK